MYSQSGKVDFDSIYMKIALQTTHTTPEVAIQTVDSLFLNTTDKTKQIRALLLGANIYQHSNNPHLSLIYANKAERLADKIKSYEWQCQSLGFIASQYRNIGFLDESENVLSKARDLVDLIKNPLRKSFFKMLIHQELAHIYFSKRKFKQVFTELRLSDSILRSLPIKHNYGYHYAIIEELRGRTYIEINNFIAAKNSFLKANSFLEPYKNDIYPLYGYIYLGLARVAIQQKDDASVLDNFKKAMLLNDQIDNINFKILLYSTLAEYHRKNKKWDEFNKFSELLAEQINLTDKNKVEAFIDLYSQTKNQNIEKQKLSVYLFAIVLFLVLAVIIVLSLYLNKLNNDKKKYNKLILGVNSTKSLSDEVLKRNNKSIVVSNTSYNSVKQNGILPETEERILNKLSEFETEEIFLNPSVSIAVLASFCETNTKYISTILKEAYQVDFNTYINQLRIYYLIDKLKEEKRYRTYKISYLSELVGFSTHSSFTTIFKKITGMTPSRFISFLDEK